MCQNMNKIVKKKKLAEPVTRLYQQADMAQQFLEIVSNTLKRCEGMTLGAGEEYEMSILFNTYDGEFLDIGYADNGVYCLDSQFIFKRYWYLVENGIVEYFYNDESDYYLKLFELGIIESFTESKCKPLDVIRFRDDNYKSYYKQCFCVSSSIIDFDMSTMPIDT